MAQQVAGSSKTLLECIRDDEIERPALMRWNAWQVWRSGAGRRPLVSRDGHTTTNAEESALWKSVMCELYGTEWSIQIASEEIEAATGAAPSSQPSEPGLVPAAGAESLQPCVPSRSRPQAGKRQAEGTMVLVLLGFSRESLLAADTEWKSLLVVDRMS